MTTRSQPLSRRSSTGSTVPRRLLLLLCTVVLVDTMFYAAVPPLLPTLSHTVDLSKSAAGILSGAYAGGMLVGSIPGGLVASRWGTRRGLYLGLALTGMTSVGFGIGTSAAVLDISRVIQGVGGAFTWSAALAWLTEITPVHRRGAVIGTAIASANAGALLGPLLGTVADAAGRALVFAALAAVAVALGAGLTVVGAR